MQLSAALCLLVLVKAALPAFIEPRAAQDDVYKLPPGFLVGAGLSATQAEGAWNTHGKSESVMDRLVHQYKTMYPTTNEVAADHYGHYKEDLALAKQLKFTSHRFSISWARILPKGDRSVINTEAVEFYRNYIDEVKKNGMEPLVTMYHFDHPYSVEEQTGGWTSDKLVDMYVDYADFLFETYGAQVKYWNPVNEGNMYCIYLPPELGVANITAYSPNTFFKCLHNTIIAHARVYRLYKEKYYSQYKGQVGSSVLIWPASPQSDKYEDTLAANLFNEVFAGTAIDPLIHGEYPASTRYLVDKRSKEQGLPESRLPHFTAAEKDLLIKGGPATDFVALNVYSGYKVEYSQDPNDHGTLGTIQEMLEPVLDDIEHVKLISGGRFDEGAGDVMRTAVLWSWTRHHLPIVITENGYGDTKKHGIQDYSSRGVYHSSNIGALVRTANEFNIPIISYHAWALLDVYEFSAGYTARPFGLIHVDYNSPTLKRTLKESSKFFIELGETGRVPQIVSSSASSLSSAVLLLLLSFVARMWQ
ncbi:myrosinase 1-like [Thrips palmi]|uniref:Myrosinase 1-like n=1 Tax=Thrips palmi TaxID=161013 RepID=A0A6P8ZLD1_THRPL|nr:myrosinase 1-like [Thrips palmi]